MCERACASDAVSAGLARKVASAPAPRVSAPSISPCTHVSGPRSNSVAVSLNTRALSITARSTEGSDLEARDRTAQFGGKLRQLSDRHIRLLRAFGRFLGNAEDALHAARDVGDRRRLALRLRGNAADQSGELARHPLDLEQRLARGVGQLRAFDDADRRLFHC